MNNYSDQISNSNHLLFHCASGELLWGQFHCICEGYFNCRLNRYDTPQSIPKPLGGGTIVQRAYHYRCRTAKGDWQAKLYQTRWTLESDPFKSGYIIYHTDQNPVEILQRCATIGASLHQTHTDRSIIYINRYDWSCHHDYNFSYKINKLLGINKNKSNDPYFWESFFHGRLMIIDSNSVMNIIEQVKSNPTELNQSEEKVFIDTHDQSNNRVGLHLTIPKTDYELAWLVFSSDQPDSELIAVVYDGSYTSLDGQIILDDKDVVSWDEYQFKTEEQDRRQAELRKKYRLLL